MTMTQAQRDFKRYNNASTRRSKAVKTIIDNREIICYTLGISTDDRHTNAIYLEAYNNNIQFDRNRVAMIKAQNTIVNANRIMHKTAYAVWSPTEMN